MNAWRHRFTMRYWTYTIPAVTTIMVSVAAAA
jgi:hypothetical protein